MRYNNNLNYRQFGEIKFRGSGPTQLGPYIPPKKRRMPKGRVGENGRVVSAIATSRGVIGDVIGRAKSFDFMFASAGASAFPPMNATRNVVDIQYRGNSGRSGGEEREEREGGEGGDVID